jgi:hypothetical protein
VFDGPLVFAGSVSLPDAFEQLEVVGLVAHHFLLLVRLDFAFEADQREFAVEVVFLLEEAVQLTKKQFFTKGSTVGLELSRFVELVTEVRSMLSYFVVHFPVLLQQICDIFLQLTELDVSEVVVGVEDGSFDLDGGLRSMVSSLADH